MAISAMRTRPLFTGTLALVVAVSGLGLTSATAANASVGAPAATVAAADVSVNAAPTYSVTIAARTCADYPDIMANRARNNIMESLQDLGNNSNYTSGAAVSPANETALSAGQTNCTPLTGWDFKLGTGIGAAATDPGGFGKLSQVSNPYSTAIQTQASIPELNSAGSPTGATLAGATTVQLSAAQVTAASQRKLWIMGGVPGAPLNNNPNMAFGALRCAIDNANGDNVEWIGFPAGGVHVFCYAYYLNTAPTSGTIRVVKDVTGPNPANQTFNFGGDVSYNPGGAFSLKDGQQIDFIRDSGQAWVINESLPAAGFSYTSVSCDSGTWAPTSNPREISVTPTVGATITCTFTNAGPVPTGRLDVYKITDGSTGTFPITVTGSGGPYAQSATTTSENQAVLATGDSTATLPVPNPYTVTETLAPGQGGTWAHTSNECYLADGTPVAITDSGVTFDLNLTADTVCFMTNSFSPAGKIKVQAMENGQGTFNSASADSTYVISDPNGVTRVQTATNSGYGSFAPAVAQSGGDVTTGLGFQQYTITGIPPQDTASGSWSVESVSCTSGNPTIDAANLYVTLTLSPTDSDVTCSFVYKLTPATGTLTQTGNKCATPARGPKKSGVATVITCQAKTQVGNVKWSVTCKARGKSGKGDIRLCRVNKLKNGKVKIRTYGKRITVTLTGRVPAAGPYQAWSKTYKWKR